MALTFADRVKETSTTTGTGTYSLAGAVAGYRTFVSAIASGATVTYCAEDGTNWEVGQGVFTDATPDTLTRATILASSNSGSAVSWSAGTRNIFLTFTARDITALQTALDGSVAFQLALVPDTSGNCFWQASAINNSNDLAPTSQPLCFKNSGSALIASYADGVPVPANFDGSRATTVTIVWRSTATSGAVVWNARYRAIASGESNDPSTWQESLAVTTTTNGTARCENYSTMTMTAANLTAGDTMLWMIGRDKSSGSDTMSADAEVICVKYEY